MGGSGLNLWNLNKRLMVWATSCVFNAVTVVVGLWFYWPKWAVHGWIEVLVPATLCGTCLTLTLWGEYEQPPAAGDKLKFKDFRILWVSFFAFCGALAILFLDYPERHFIWETTHIFAGVLGYTVGMLVLVVRSRPAQSPFLDPAAPLTYMSLPLGVIPDAPSTATTP